MDATLWLLAAISAVLLVRASAMIVRFNRRMPELWQLLETKDRSRRVRELTDNIWYNLPAARYLYDEVDFEDPEIRGLKLTLMRMHRAAISSLLMFIVSSTATVAAWL